MASALLVKCTLPPLPPELSPPQNTWVGDVVLAVFVPAFAGREPAAPGLRRVLLGRTDPPKYGEGKARCQLIEEGPCGPGSHRWPLFMCGVGEESGAY